MPDPNDTSPPDHQQPSTNSTSAGASWAFCITPVGSNTKRAPAPGVAGAVRRPGAPDRLDATEGGPHPAEEQPHACHAAECTHSAADVPRVRSRLRQTAENKREILLATRLNKAEDAAVRAAAAACGMTPSGFLAHAALSAARDLERTAAEIADAKQLVAELFAARRQLGRIGTNLNQITKAINSGAEPGQTGAVLAAVLRAAARVDAAAVRFLDE